MRVKLTSSKNLIDIWQETSYRCIADEQTLLKWRLPDVNITSNRLVLSGHEVKCGQFTAVNESVVCVKSV